MRFKAGDRVRVIKSKTPDKRDHIGRMLIISDVDKDWEYPYSTQGGCWLWCDDELEPAPITNFERIKAMSVEEMAELIDKNYKCRKCYYYGHCNGDCHGGIKKWLESEVSE